MTVGRDGKTSYERNKGKKAQELEYEFAEGVWWRKVAPKTTLKKLEIMWQEGVYLGRKATTGETIVGTAEGIFRTRTLKKKPEQDRWDPKHSDMVGGVPRRTTADDDSADGEKLPTTLRPENFETLNSAKEKDEIAKTTAPKGFMITKADLDKYAYTKGCQGCTAVLRGLRAQTHTMRCRERLEGEMKDVEKVKQAKRKMTEYLAKVIQKDVEQREKKINKAKEEVKLIKEERDAVEADDVRPEAARGSKDPKTRARDEDDGEEGREGGNAKKMKVESEGCGEKNKREDEGEEGRRAKRSKGNANVAELMEVFPTPHDDMEENVEEWAADDVTGLALDDKAVREAREEEMTFVKNIPLYEEVDTAVCWARLGKGAVSTKWVDIEKSDGDEKIVRSRWVARDFKGKGEEDREDLFAATPPLEAKKMLFKWVRRKRRDGKANKEKVMLIDVRKAHLNAPCEDEVYVELPKEAGAPGKCGKLRRWLYGMRPAAAGWEKEYVTKLATVGFVRGKYSPVVFYNKETGVRLAVHGDDFTFTGNKGELLKVKSKMEEWWDLKFRGMLGGEPGDDKEVSILGRKILWGERAIHYQADPKHALRVVEEMGLGSGSRAVDSPIEKEVVSDDGEELLEKEQAGRFRRVAATLNYLAVDRPDIQYATKEVCRGMAAPAVKHMVMLKRIGRYLLNKPVVVIEFTESPEEDLETVVGYCDTDWAGCRRTRKSTSGGMLVVGGSIIKSWAKTQTVIATSSGEAEFYGLGKGSAEALGFKSLCEDMGMLMKTIIMWVDSTAAKAVAGRIGAGKLRHVEVCFLWIQSQVQAKKLMVRKIPGDKNPADILTKPQFLNEMKVHLEKLNVYVNLKTIDRDQVVEGC